MTYETKQKKERWKNATQFHRLLIIRHDTQWEKCANSIMRKIQCYEVLETTSEGKFL
jgi:hypothetical protein